MKKQWFIFNEIFAVIVGQDCFGKEVWKDTRLTQHRGKVPTWEVMALRPTHISVVLARFSGRHQNGWEDRNVWNILRKDIDLEDPTSLLTKVCLGWSQRSSEVDREAFQSKAVLFRRITTTEVTEEKQSTR